MKTKEVETLAEDVYIKFNENGVCVITVTDLKNFAVKVADQEKQALKEKVRTAVADYMRSEGCSCCRGDDHNKHSDVIAALLDVPRYSDDSGNNFNQFAT